MSSKNLLPQKRKASTAFKPPRPANRATNSKKPSSRRKSAPTRTVTSSENDDAGEDDENLDDDKDQSTASSASTSNSPTPDSQSDPPPVIPPALLSKLIHHTFPDKNMRINKDAMSVVGKYMETFVREAIARAAYERQEELENRREKGEKIRPGEGFLDVEDLEKLAPQLVLDF